jgi:hypothetical protein
MTAGRIFFTGNPWPEGHAIKEFRWSAERRGSQIWFGFHLESARYYAERKIEDDESVEYPSDWEAPIVWGNFHSCTISSDKWHPGGFPVCEAAEYGAERIDGLHAHVDSLPTDLEESYECRAFHIYLLGHDAVADHQIIFSRVTGTECFDILWEGKIALAYVGDYEPKYRFRAEIKGAKLPAVVAA